MAAVRCLISIGWNRSGTLSMVFLQYCATIRSILIRAMPFSVSEAAKSRLVELFAKNPQAKALRLGIRGGGCSGYSYLF